MEFGLAADTLFAPQVLVPAAAATVAFVSGGAARVVEALETRRPRRSRNAGRHGARA